MHVKRSRFILLMLCAIMAVAIFAACSNDNGNGNADANRTNNSGNNGGNDANEDVNSNNQSPDLSPITFSINRAAEKMSWDTPITKKMEEVTGVTLKYEVTVGDEFQKWDLWLASGDYPDIVVLDTNYIAKYKDAGALMPLNDLIDQYGPHIKEAFGQYYNLLKDENGEIYGLYAAKKSANVPANAVGSFVVQNAVLKEAGYPTLTTLDDLYKVIKDYAEKYPEINGQKTIGYGGAGKSYMFGIQFNNPISWASGYPDHGEFKIDEDGSVHWIPVTENAKKYYTFLNKLYNEGLFDKEAFSNDSLAGKMSQGRVLAAYAPAWTIGDAEKTLRQAGMADRTYAHIPLYLDADMRSTDRNNSTTPTFAGSYNWAITKDTKNPERIIQLIDYMFSDEGQILTNWGIEGVHYDMVDGKRQLKPEVIENRATDPDYNFKQGFEGIKGGSNGYWFSFGNGAILDDGDYATPVTPDYVRRSYDDATIETLGSYGKQVWADFLAPMNVVPGYLWQLPAPEETKVVAQKIDDEWHRLLPKVIMAANDQEFESAWENMVNTITDEGLAEMEAAYTELWGNYVEKYNNTIGQ